MKKSQISEEAWKLAAKYLESDISARVYEITKEDIEYYVTFKTL